MHPLEGQPCSRADRASTFGKGKGGGKLKGGDRSRGGDNKGKGTGGFKGEVQWEPPSWWHKATNRQRAEWLEQNVADRD